ncbi:hypothetical protein [Streptomyces sp. NPDC058773]|uniref:hypothetical protein n=1 Tax=Streptomyces sp. NPDC058773 TaxID=3346632 RepID=UPI0036B9F6C9
MPRAPERATPAVLARQSAPGFRAVGLAEPDPGLLWDVLMPADTTGATQRDRLRNAKAPAR